MSERNRRMKAVILSLRETGENNRLVKIISAENGIFTAMLYGGPKSRLKSLVQPFNSGILYIYSDEARHSVKITDFDVKQYHITFRSSLFKSWAASFAGEILFKTKCAGDKENAFVLLSAFLDGMDSVDEQEARLGTLRFLWRYTGLMGLQPETRICHVCGTSLLSHESNACYVENQNGFICSDCLTYSTEKNKDASMKMDLDSLTYLSAINELSPGQVRSLFISPESAYNMKRFLYRLIEKSCGTKLDTLESGIGIL